WGGLMVRARPRIAREATRLTWSLFREALVVTTPSPVLVPGVIRISRPLAISSLLFRKAPLWGSRSPAIISPLLGSTTSPRALTTITAPTIRSPSRRDQDPRPPFVAEPGP